MRGQGVEEWIAVELVVAINADLQRAVAHRPSNAEDNIAVVELAVVQRPLGLLIDFAGNQFGGAGYAAAIPAPIGQLYALIAQALQEWLAVIDLEGHTTSIGESDGEISHTQISLVQSPPG